MCHAGLSEVIVPIFYEDVLIAYLQIGQFRDKKQIEPPYRQLRQVAAQCGRSVDELLALYQEVPVISDEKLTSLCNIMDILIKTFWHDGLIHYKRSMLSIKIDQYITDHLSEKITTARLCGEFFLSKNALYQLFEKEMGMTVNEFIVQKRLRLACDYLTSNRNINVTQVAALCGFPDYNYFIRLFKKEYGVTPLQYRKSKLVD